MYNINMKYTNFIPVCFFIGTVFIYYIVSEYDIDNYRLYEGFSEKRLTEYREDTEKIKMFPDPNSRTYCRFFEIVMDEPSFYRDNIIQIKNKTKIDEKSRVLDAGCGTGRHIQIIKELIPTIMIEGIDISKNMISRAEIRNPGTDLLCTNLTIPEIYKPESLTHILTLFETLHHNTPNDISTILTNYYKWLVPGGYCVFHIFYPDKLDPGPKSYSQYTKGKNNQKVSFTQFEGFSHEAWWEKEKSKMYWYRYCEKYIITKEKNIVKTTNVWIPPSNKMISFITKHNFELKEVIDLHSLGISDFGMYIFQKK